MRAPGMTWFRLPLFLWSHVCDQRRFMVLGTPVLAITLLLLALERLFTSASSIRRSAAIRFCSSTCSGFIPHPAVYIMILPGMGVISEIIACFSRKRMFGYSFVAFSSVAIAVLGFLVWGHHMFVTGNRSMPA